MRIDKDQVAAQAVTLFGQEGGNGSLVLVSSDSWNGVFYEDNVVIVGEPLGRPVPTRQITSGPGPPGHARTMSVARLS